jgi:hypothetical protein
VLAESYLGSRIINMYYRLSPLGAKMLDKSPLLKYLTKKSFQWTVIPYVEWHLKKTGNGGS